MYEYNSNVISTESMKNREGKYIGNEYETLYNNLEIKG